MSAHNMQPWEIELDPADPRLLRVFLARDRLLPATDPFSRQILMSVGGFLALLEDAAAARGLDARIDLFTIEELAAEDSGASFAVPIAEVRIAPSSGPAGSWYPDAISGATVKADLAAVSLPPAQLRSCLRWTPSKGSVRFVQDAGSLAELKPILKAAFRLEMQHEPTLMESYRLMRRNRRQLEAQPWGLSYGSNFPQKSLGAIELFESLFPMKMKKWGLRGADNFDQEMDKAVTFLILTTANSRPRLVRRACCPEALAEGDSRRLRGRAGVPAAAGIRGDGGALPGDPPGLRRTRADHPDDRLPGAAEGRLPAGLPAFGEGPGQAAMNDRLQTRLLIR
jgi:hypothetical protein